MEIEELLQESVKRQASDLHIVPNMPPIFRIDGDLVPGDVPPLTPAMTQHLLFSFMTPIQKEMFETNLTLDTAISFPHLGNFRVNVFHEMNGIAAVFRVVPKTIATFDELGLPNVFKRLLTLPHGLILLTGPTGSGKSTTLAAMIDFINTNHAYHVITIEDPIEYIHQSKKSAINQIQIGRDTKDFSDALRAALRQDPDVILVGELRDLETIRLALTGAETGHLVLGTLHASTAPFAISRIVDIFPTAEKNRVRNLLAETLQAIICQVLVKKVPAGRVAAFEIMLATPAIKHLIRQDMVTQMESTIQTSGDVGMCTFSQYVQQLAAKRLISATTARGFTEAVESFNPALNKKKP